MTIQNEEPNHQHQKPIPIEFMGDIRTKGFTVTTSDNIVVDAYVVFSPDDTPRLALVGIPDAHHGWLDWGGYEVFGLVQQEEQDEVVDPRSVPFEAIVNLAINRLLGDRRLRARCGEESLARQGAGMPAPLPPLATKNTQPRDEE